MAIYGNQNQEHEYKPFYSSGTDLDMTPQLQY